MAKYKIIILILAMWGLGGRVEAVEKMAPTAFEASESATVLIPTEVEELKENITEAADKEVGYRLESVLDQQKVGQWNGLNSARIVVRKAVDRGVAANTIVLLLLLPLIATGVSVLHYVFGFSGYGIFMPTMIAVVFLATGIVGGLGLFATILGISLICNEVLRRFKLHFWPARSISLMFIALGTFGLMWGTSFFEAVDIRNMSIFPVLLMIMLAEEFVRTQLAKSGREAKRLTVGTLILAILGATLMSVRQVQEWVILHPEFVLLAVLATNIVVGSYKGIRMMEIKRFGKAIRREKGFKSKKKETHV
ncbi:MAG: 7TM domain-containing protein [Candidatus Shapirobacteria bacterium]|jgi:hypothetical protein